MDISSELGHKITKVDVFRDRYVFARTAKSLILGDLTSNVVGEILWSGSGKEQLYFDNPEVMA